MDDTPPLMRFPELPLLTLATVAAAAIVSGDAELSRALVMDRAAAATGEWWRYVTASLVHFSGRHLALDVMTLFAAGLIIESRSRRAMAALLALAGVGGTVAVMAESTALDFFGGLSGVAFGAVVLGALMLLRDGGRAREFAFGVLGMCALKLGWELSVDRTITSADGSVISVAVAAHVAGAMAALAIAAGRRARRFIPAGLLLVSGCLPSAVANRTAPAGITIASTVARTPTPAADTRMTLTFPLRVAVVFAAGDAPVRKGTPGPNIDLAPLSGAEKSDMTTAIAQAVRDHPSVSQASALEPLTEIRRTHPGFSWDTARAAVIPKAGTSEVQAGPIMADSATDLVLVIGYEQQQRSRDLWATPVISAALLVGGIAALATDTSNLKEMLVYIGAIAGAGTLAYVLPSQAHRTSTTVDITAYHPRTGRVLFRTARSDQRRGVQSLAGFKGAMREQAAGALTTVTNELRAAIADALTELERRARSAPDEFEIIQRR